MRFLASFLSLGLLFSCGGVSPDPQAMADDLPEARDLDEATRSELRRQTDEALAALEEGRADRARRIAEAVLARDPRDARARAIRACGLMARARAEDPPTLGPWREAEGEFLRARRLAPGDPVIGVLHARFLQADGHLTAAVERLDEVLAVHPDDREALRLAGWIRYDLGDEREAARRLARLLTVSPDEAEAVYRLAHCHARLAPAQFGAEERRSEFDAAVAAFTRYRELAPDDPDGWLAEAHVRFALWAEDPDPDDDPAAAIAILELYEGAQERTPGGPEPAFGRGVVLERLEAIDEARLAYLDALANDGAHLPSLLNLAVILVDDGRRDEAEFYLRRALDHDLPDRERGRIETFLRTGPDGTR